MSNSSFSIYVDADSCPVTVREFILKYALNHAVHVTFAANRIIPGPEKNNFFTMIVCDKTEGAADEYIVLHSAESDIVVTRDIPLAARLVEKNIPVMNDRGTLFTKENIGERLSERNFALQLAQIGLGGDKRSTYSKKNFSEFAACFDREMQKRLAK